MKIITKKSTIKIRVISTLFFFAAVLQVHAENTPDVNTIVEKMDRLYRSNTSYGEVEMMIQTEHWERTLSMNIWSEGLDKTLIYIRSPRKDAGIATLRKKNEMWNYFPKINKVIKVPPSMMMSSWMGSDFTNDDIVKESSMIHDYHSRIMLPENASPDYYYIELIPKKDLPIVWARIELVVRKKDYIPVEESFFDEKGRKMRVMEFSEIRKFSGREIPSVLVMSPLNKPGKKTVIKYIDLEFDIMLDADTFSLRNLQKKRN
ncbi:MAG: outer membrane lipoprotein-sorting protein [Nitrospiraceae bacterium]|nr:MAG: outer membrane lipoprotein-sorting protein [Nitrospiraceae bacterium]